MLALTSMSKAHASGPRFRNLFTVLMALLMSGCDGGMSLLLSLGAGAAVGSWWARNQRRQRALPAASAPLPALNPAEQRVIEQHLRGELALVQAGEAVSIEREWLARARLGALLVSQWRLEDAKEVYLWGRPPKDPRLASLTAFGRHEIDLLTQSADQNKLETLRADRQRALSLASKEHLSALEAAWNALEGLCLIRMGRAREGADLISPSLPNLSQSPSRVVYHYHLGQAFEHMHEIPAAIEQYRRCSEAAPGTRLASEAQSRQGMLGSGQPGSVGFRALPPRLPEMKRGRALGAGQADGDSVLGEANSKVPSAASSSPSFEDDSEDPGSDDR